MDGYPAHYVTHNIPLIALFGLGTPDPNSFDEIENEYRILQERGIRISSDLPDVTGPTAEELLNCFQDFDARDAAWNNRPGKGKMGTIGFTYRSVGRTILLPPHKAALPISSDDSERAGLGHSSLVPTLHSPLSPLSIDSPVFPDGIMTPFWFSKHQLLLPSALISFFNFTLDHDKSTLQDNRLKNEINALKSSISASGYKFRLVVVLVAEDEGSHADVGERVVNVRKATVMDPKSLYFLPRNTSVVELRAFIGTVLSNLQPTCIEYYRDLSKHARRKKNRGTIPPPTTPPTSGTSQTLTTQGWNVRYDTKLGFFAEFRQEMDAAGRSYEAAYETLLDGDSFETIPSWSPKFNDTRLLADILAIRILRCLLWAGQTTSAVQSWSNHLSRIRDLVERKGKGSEMYGWEAWEARWSSVMAELVGKVDLPIFQVSESLKMSDSTSGIPDVFAPAEKLFASEVRIAPWDFLHHPGYWLDRSAKHTRARRKLAIDIPQEDRNPPSRSPASMIPSRVHLYDTYLCPEPHVEYGRPGLESFDHSMLLIDTLTEAARNYSLRGQTRATEKATFEACQELMVASRFQEAMATLKPLWKTLSWRRHGWWQLTNEVSWSIRACALEMGDWEMLVAVEWELMSSSLPTRSEWIYNFHHCLDELDVGSRPKAAINFEDTAPCLSANFTFGKPTGNVGLVEAAQLSITSHLQSTSAAITLSYIDLNFNGSLRGVRLMHMSSDGSAIKSSHGLQYFDIVSKESQFSSETLTLISGSVPDLPRATATVDLTFLPGQSKVFCLRLLPREAGDVRALEAILVIEERLFNFEITVPLQNQFSGPDWWIPIDNGLARDKLNFEDQCHIHIEPKPPKLKLTIPRSRSTYYIDEEVRIQIRLLNGEDDTASIRLGVSLSGSGGTTPTLQWWTEGLDQDNIVTHAPTSRLSDRDVGQIRPSEAKEMTVAFKALPEMAEFVLVVRADYIIVSDPETPLSIQIKEKVIFTGPFEANYSFIPRIHPEPWPSYFLLEEEQESSAFHGLKQRWLLEAKIKSFAVEPLLIHATHLSISDSRYTAVTQLEAVKKLDSSKIMEPNDQVERPFGLDVQKATLEDRRSALISAQLNILWSRQDEPEGKNTASLLLPALTIPFGEPRVLVAAQTSTKGTNPSVIMVSYSLENPSSHFLSFSLTMETNEDFAFSGPKATSTQLVPRSRHDIRYNILPVRRGVWIRPIFRVIDTGFGQELRTHATEGCKDDKKGIAIWVPE